MEEGMEEGGGNCLHLLLLVDELPHLSAAGSCCCLFLIREFLKHPYLFAATVGSGSFLPPSFGCTLRVVACYEAHELLLASFSTN